MEQIVRHGTLAFLQPAPAGNQEHRAGKAHAQALWARMQAGSLDGFALPRAVPAHSDAIAAVDAEGNMVSILHSINGVFWGMTGIFVDGVSIPDSGSVQPENVAATAPGARMSDPTNPTLVTRGGKPLLACAAIGMGLHAKTVQALHSVIDFGMTPDEAAQAPAVGGLEFTDPAVMRGRPTVSSRFDPAVVQAANAMGAGFVEIDMMQGGWAAASIDPATGQRHGGVVPVWAVQPNNDGKAMGH